MVDLILYLLLGATVLALGVWGGIVGAKALPESENKPLHFWGIVGIGVVAFVLTVVVGMRNYYAQKDAATQQNKLNASLKETSDRLQKANQTLDQSRLSEEYMKGQLSGLSMMVGKLSTDGSSGSAALAKALVGMAGTKAPAGVEAPAIQRMTNKQLENKVIEFAKDMRVFAAQLRNTESAQLNQRQAAMSAAMVKDGGFKPGVREGPAQKQAWDAANANQLDWMNRVSLEITQQYSGQAIQYHEELERRIGPDKPLTGIDSMLVLWVPIHGTFVSDGNLVTSADILEQMARKLPD